MTAKYSEAAVKEGRKPGERFGPPKGVKVRPVEKRDFEAAFRKVHKTGDAAKMYKEKESSEDGGDGGGGAAGGVDMRLLAQMMAQMMGNSGGGVGGGAGKKYDADDLD